MSTSGSKASAEVATKRMESIDVGNGDCQIVEMEKDKALALLQNHIEVDLNSPAAKRVLRKIDMIVLPLLCAIYTFMLIDKSSLSFAGIMGIKTDCNLNGSQFSWLGSLVYFGYLAGDIPAMIAMQRFPLDKVFAGVVISWGIVVASHAAAKDFAGLAVLRFFLGFGEVFTAPAVIQMLTSWYTKEEQVTRLTIWYMCYGFGNIIGGFLAWCIYQSPYFKWQALYILYGSITVVLGVLAYFLLPASPTGARWFTEEEKTIALERVRHNKTGTEVWRFNKGQLIEALKDERLYLIFIYVICIGLPSGGLTVFGPSIIAGFGFTNEQSTLLSMGPGAAAVAGVLLSGVVAKYVNRTSAGIFVHAVSVIGTIMMLAIPSDKYGARYGGYILALWFPNSVPFLFALMTAGTSGSTKRFAFSASYQLAYAVGNIIGPQTYTTESAPQYYPAKFTMLGFLLLGGILLGIYGLDHKIRNLRRDKRDVRDAQNGIVHTIVENEEFLDKTDHEIRSFRYPL